MRSVLNIILTHQSSGKVSEMIDYWRKYVPTESILIAYGGTKNAFEGIQHHRKFFVADPRLHTRDHQRQMQSYTGMFQSAAEFLKSEGQQFQFVHFAEYDHVPLVPDLNQRQIDRLMAEGADLFGFHVHRIDGTSNPHFLYHAADERFTKHWASITRRDDPTVVLSMFGSGSFWTREAFCAVCEIEEPCPIYMEVYLPTLAHHLGFRVRDFLEQNQFVRALESYICSVDEARAQGAWTLHPVKRMWENPKDFGYIPGSKKQAPNNA